eukprot:6097649-Alexandrium_andersonii.AAC.1
MNATTARPHQRPQQQQLHSSSTNPVEVHTHINGEREHIYGPGSIPDQTGDGSRQGGMEIVCPTLLLGRRPREGT